MKLDQNWETSLPSKLMVLLNLLLFGNGCDEFGFSLPVKAIAQIILYKFKNRVRSNSISTHRRNNTAKILHFCYMLAQKYIVTRSGIVIDILLDILYPPLCIYYEIVLRVIKSLSDATLNLFEQEEAVYLVISALVCLPYHRSKRFKL